MIKKENFFYVVLFLTFGYSIFHFNFLSILFDLSFIITFFLFLDKAIEFVDIFLLTEGFMIIVPKNKFDKEKLEKDLSKKIINLFCSGTLIALFCFLNKWDFSFYIWFVLSLSLFSVEFVKLKALKKINLDNI